MWGIYLYMLHDKNCTLAKKRRLAQVVRGSLQKLLSNLSLSAYLDSPSLAVSETVDTQIQKVFLGLTRQGTMDLWGVLLVRGLTRRDFARAKSLKNPYPLDPIVQSLQHGANNGGRLGSVPKREVQKCAATMKWLKTVSVVTGDQMHWMNAMNSYYTRCLNPWSDAVCHALWCFFGCKRIEGAAPRSIFTSAWNLISGYAPPSRATIRLGSYIALAKALYLATRTALDIELFHPRADRGLEIKLPEHCTWRTGQLLQSAVIVHCQRALSQVYSAKRLRIEGAYDSKTLGRAIELSLAYAAREHAKLYAKYGSDAATSTAEIRDRATALKAAHLAVRTLRLVNTVESIQNLLQLDPEMYPLVTRYGMSQSPSPIFKCRDGTAQILPAAVRLPPKGRGHVMSMFSGDKDFAPALDALLGSAHAFERAAAQWIRHESHGSSGQRLRFSVGCHAERVSGIIHDNVLTQFTAPLRAGLLPAYASIQSARRSYYNQTTKITRLNPSVSKCGVLAESYVADMFLCSVLLTEYAKSPVASKIRRFNPLCNSPRVRSLRRSIQTGNLTSILNVVNLNAPPSHKYYDLGAIFRRAQPNIEQCRRSIFRMVLYTSLLCLICSDLRAFELLSSTAAERGGLFSQDTLAAVQNKVALKIRDCVRYLCRVHYAPADLITRIDLWVINATPSTPLAQEDETTEEEPSAYDETDEDEDREPEDEEFAVVDPFMGKEGEPSDNSAAPRDMEPPASKDAGLFVIPEEASQEPEPEPKPDPEPKPEPAVAFLQQAPEPPVLQSAGDMMKGVRNGRTGHPLSKSARSPTKPARSTLHPPASATKGTETKPQVKTRDPVPSPAKPVSTPNLRTRVSRAVDQCVKERVPQVLLTEAVQLGTASRSTPVVAKMLVEMRAGAGVDRVLAQGLLNEAVRVGQTQIACDRLIQAALRKDREHRRSREVVPSSPLVPHYRSVVRDAVNQEVSQRLLDEAVRIGSTRIYAQAQIKDRVRNHVDALVRSTLAKRALNEAVRLGRDFCARREKARRAVNQALAVEVLNRAVGAASLHLTSSQRSRSAAPVVPSANMIKPSERLANPASIRAAVSGALGLGILDASVSVASRHAFISRWLSSAIHSAIGTHLLDASTHVAALAHSNRLAIERNVRERVCRALDQCLAHSILNEAVCMGSTVCTIRSLGSPAGIECIYDHVRRRAEFHPDLEPMLKKLRHYGVESPLLMLCLLFEQ